MTFTSSRNPMELVDRYLQAVRFWLPKTKRQEDLVAELGEDLRSQLDAKEEELGRPLDRADISAILKACGSPMAVATRLGPQRYLIGPALFPIYLFVLKMVLLWILVPVFAFIVGPVNLANTGGDWGRAAVTTLGDIWSGGFIAAAIITLVFAILERTQAIAGVECKWDPSTLPPLEKPERKTSFVQTVCELAFNIFGFVWLLLIPGHPFMVLGPASHFLIPAPIWHTFYLPIVVLAALGIVRLAVILVRPQWGWFPLASQLLQSALTLILLHFIIRAVQQVPASDWYPFVALANSVRNSPQFIRIAAIVNVCILISVVSTWIGVSIAGIIQSWKLMNYVRKQASVAREPASLQVR